MNKSKLYKFRRKGQQIAYKLTTPRIMSKIYFRIVLKKKLNFNKPKSFNEKLQWLKLFFYPRSEIVINAADKYKVREYLELKGYHKYINELIAVWDQEDNIEWDKLPEQFVLKCTHGCGYNIICSNKSDLDIVDAKNKLKKWMHEDFATYNAEPHYSKIPRKIICEKYLGENIVNYNIFCCNGEPKFFSVIEGLGEGINEALTYYCIDGTKAEFYSRAYPTSNSPLPPALGEMKEIASEIAQDFPFVRVDFFYVDGRVIFSELTFTPGGAMIPFAPPETDEKLGKLLDISKYKS